LFGVEFAGGVVVEIHFLLQFSLSVCVKTIYNLLMFQKIKAMVFYHSQQISVQVGIQRQ